VSPMLLTKKAIRMVVPSFVISLMLAGVWLRGNFSHIFRDIIIQF
jgi:hypothetical protein